MPVRGFVPMTDPQTHESCLVRKFSHFVALGDDDQRLLRALEQKSEEVHARHVVCQADNDVERLFVVGEGWFYSYTLLPDGRRHVLQMHYPGDLIGVDQLPFRRSTYDVAAATDGVLCPFPKQAFDAILRESPLITALVFSITLIDKAVALDRFRAASRMSAKESLAHFLLTIQSRLKITNPDLGSRFRLPLTQELIGDAIGLTNVTVSRAMSQLEEEGFLRRHGSDIELPRRDELERLIGHVDRFTAIDTSWFPA